MNARGIRLHAYIETALVALKEKKEEKLGKQLIKWVEERTREEVLHNVIQKTARRECLFCDTSLDKEFGEERWHVPLCKKHRLKEIKKLYERGKE